MFSQSIRRKPLRFCLFLLLCGMIFCETAWLAALAPTDVTHYECYGLVFWLGSHATTLLPQTQCAFLSNTAPQTMFHALPLEYPPLTVLLFSLPLLAPLAYYALSFALFMTLVVGLICWLLAHSGVQRAAPIFLLYLLLGAAAVAQVRFDLLPAACTLVCVLAAERGRWRTAYVMLALGVLLKLYPIVAFPALFLAEQRAWPSEQEPSQLRRWRWQNSLLFVSLLIVVMGGFALLNYQEAILSPLSYFLQRPPQIEALASSVIWINSYFGLPYQVSFSFGSLNLASGLSGLISQIDTLLALAGIIWVFSLQWRRRIDFAQTMVALVCVLLTTGKVFSPQYLIWLFPLLAYIFAAGKTNRCWMYAWAVISLLTTFIYIFYYSRLLNPLTDAQVIQTLPGFFELVALRNLCLLLTTLAFLSGWWRTRQLTAALVE
jgi:hypothetical protein